MFGAVARASEMMCEDRTIDSSWKEDLEDYIEKNRED